MHPDSRRYFVISLGQGVLAEDRFEAFSRNWSQVVRGIRSRGQPMIGPLHEGFVVHRLFREVSVLLFLFLP
jgi:hypothetical protein